MEKTGTTEMYLVPGWLVLLVLILVIGAVVALYRVWRHRSRR